MAFVALTHPQHRPPSSSALGRLLKTRLAERAIDPATLAPEDAYLAATTAQFNLILDQAAETSLLFIEFGRKLKAQVIDAAGEDGTISAAAGTTLKTWLKREWSRLWLRWLNGDRDAGLMGFNARRRQAAQFAVDAHRMLHAYFFAPIKERAESLLTEQDGDAALFGGAMAAPDAPPFTDQIDAVLKARDAQLIGAPPYTWSQRLWKHQNGGLNKMTALISRAVAEKMSAWDLAGELEDFLSVDARWTRWTRARLYTMTPADRIKDKKGLIRKPGSIKAGETPPAKGVAYAALRLARTELQAIHNMATDMLIKATPWVEEERIMRSATATACAICDPVAGAPGGDGTVYAKGTISLPLHPLCLCFKLFELMKRDVFMTNVTGWLKGENSFLDTYQPFMQQDDSLMGAIKALLGGMGWQTSLPLETWG